MSSAFGDLADLPKGLDASAVALGQLRQVILGNVHAVRAIAGDRFVGRWREWRLALKGRLDEGRQLLQLAGLALGIPLPEGRHHLAGEELQGFTDVIVAVLAALLDEDRLIDASLRERAQRLAQLGGSADAAGAGPQHLGADLV